MQKEMRFGETFRFLHFILSHPEWLKRKALIAFGLEAGKYFQRAAYDRLVDVAAKEGYGYLLDFVVMTSLGGFRDASYNYELKTRHAHK